MTDLNSRDSFKEYDLYSHRGKCSEEQLHESQMYDLHPYVIHNYNRRQYCWHIVISDPIFSGTRRILALPPLNPNPHPPGNVVYRLVLYVTIILQHWMGGTGVNGTECSKWKEKVLNMERKPFLVYNVSTIFVTYCSLDKHWTYTWFC